MLIATLWADAKSIGLAAGGSGFAGVASSGGRSERRADGTNTANKPPANPPWVRQVQVTFFLTVKERPRPVGPSASTETQ